MIKKLFTGWMIAFALSCTLANTLSAQVIYLNTENKGLFSVDMGNNFKVEKLSAFKDWNMGSIAMYRDSFYFLDRTTNSLHSTILDPVNPKYTDLERSAPGGTNSLTADSTGVLWALSSVHRNLSSNRSGHFVGFNLGIPFQATGDLVFYNGKLYVSAEEGIVELSTAYRYPSTSTLIIPTNGRVFAGLINVAVGCEGNKVFGVETIAGITHLVEIDIDNQKILGTYASFSLDNDKVLDAASFNETGERPFVRLRWIHIKPACFPETSTEIFVSAFASTGESSVTYSLTKGTEKKVMAGQHLPVTFNEPAAPGTWNLNLASIDGCTMDTTLIIYGPGKVTAAIETVKPDTCGMSNGVAIVKMSEGLPPFLFMVAGLLETTSPEIRGLPAGNYKLTIRDKTTCENELTFTIGSYSGRDPIMDLNIVPGSVCAKNGEIKVWYRASATVDSSRLDDENFGKKDHFTGLLPGPHKLQMKMGNCVYDTVIVVPLSTATPVIDSLVTNNICLGTGNIRVVISGREGPYRFEVAGGMYNSGIEVRNLSAGIHPVKIYNAARCLVDSFAFRVKEKGDCDTLQAIYVPSGFTPNGDGKNDLLTPLNNPLGKVAHFIFRIYNRGGQVLYESSAAGKGWDGRYKNIPQPTGTYVWMFEAIAADGKRIYFSGTTVLIR